MSESHESAVLQLATQLGTDWASLTAARTRSIEKRLEIEKQLAGFDSGDVSIIVSGSLARDEFTPGSDIDWTLLVDGGADPRHLDLAQKVDPTMKAAANKPTGPEGTFGKMVFSHDLIHQIGGEDDTNRNTTRRILMLLESKAVGRPDAHERVVRNILHRYLSEDWGFMNATGKYHVPRFLLNDFARYWRTMAVDFAYKQRTRSGQGSAIRNIKLRMSRKLIYVAGLLTCFSCHLDMAQPGCASSVDTPKCIDCLKRILDRTPLEILASVFLRFKHLDRTAAKLFNAYNGFLEMVSDDAIRTHLEALPMEDARSDETYTKARLQSHDFRDGLDELFFGEDSEFGKLTKTYGVF